MRILQRNLKRTTDTHYRHIPLHFSHKERTPVQISLQYLLKEMPGSLASRTFCIFTSISIITCGRAHNYFMKYVNVAEPKLEVKKTLNCRRNFSPFMELKFS